MAETKLRVADELRFLAFYVNILTSWALTLKSFSCIIFKSVMHVTNNQFSDKFNDGWKKNQNGLFIYVNNLTLWPQ